MSFFKLIFWIVIKLISINIVVTQYVIPLSTTNYTDLDVTRCKYTQAGTEYTGDIAVTVGGVQCQFWKSSDQIHEVDPTIKSELFPEKSLFRARNYCRNPTRDYYGPWCYTLDPTLIWDYCDVPLCNSGECRISGIGAEYDGKIEITLSKKKCEEWDKVHKINDEKIKKFSNSRFPSQSRDKSQNYCRNPDDRIGGPWCYTEDKSFDFIVEEYCDIPFCDDKECILFTRNNTSKYSILTNLNDDVKNITFWIKLWNPADERNAEVRILLSLLPIPTLANFITKEWQAGIEIVISNKKSGVIHSTDKTFRDFEETPRLLLGTKWTGLWVTWASGFISVGTTDSLRPIFTEEYRMQNNTTIKNYDDHFFYYGLSGAGVLWSTPFCEISCEKHVTFGSEIHNIWPVRKSTDLNEIIFNVRAHRHIFIRLFTNVQIIFPSFMIVIGDGNTVSFIYQSTKDSPKQYLKVTKSKGLLNFFNWQQFTISIFSSQLRLYFKKTYGSEELLHYQHDLVSAIRWFGVGSENGIAMWTFFCPPTEMKEKFWPPECVTSLSDFEYKGSQWTAEAHMPCVPWISKNIPKTEKIEMNFPEGSLIKVLNKCRNPTKDPRGPYCYTFTKDSENVALLTKSYCPIHTCESSECKMAGTANDYIGNLSTTRSKRICAKWITKIPVRSQNKTKINNTTNVDKEELNATKQYTKSNNSNKSQTALFDNDDDDNDNNNHTNNSYLEKVKNDSNFCRNPNRNIAGTWCYTTDETVSFDLCDVRDCDKPDRCINYIRGNNAKRRLLVLPEYRSEGLSFSVKGWEPDNPDYLAVIFTADNNLRSMFKLIIGDQANEKVSLYYRSETEDIKLMKMKSLSHLIYWGKWSDFVIKVPRGSIKLYYEGAADPLFEWIHPEPAKAFLPVYYYFDTQNYTMGLSFECPSRCHIENTTTESFTRILPVSSWKQESKSNLNQLQLMIRANKNVTINFFRLIEMERYEEIIISNGNSNWITFSRVENKTRYILKRQTTAKSLYTANSWTNLTISWSNNNVYVWSNETIIFTYVTRRPVLFYYFTVSTNKDNWAVWTANCVPPDIEGEPVDGSWSEWGPWACSVSCNGGLGTRTRVCNSPPPNLKGEPCLGPNTMTGRCNLIQCGDITENTKSLIRKRLRYNFTAIITDVEESVEILPDYDIIQMISNESPKSLIAWMHNGEYVMNNSRRFVYSNKIVILKSNTADSGIYSLVLQRVDFSQNVIKVVSLAVIANFEVTLRETSPYYLTCNSIDLGYYYSHLTIMWQVNDKVWKNYGTTLPVTVNIDYIPQINSSHNGVWKCIVKQSDLEFEWITNILLIKVIGPPNWRTFLMEDEMTRWIFGWLPDEDSVILALIFIVVLVISCIILIMHIDFRKLFFQLVNLRKR